MMKTQKARLTIVGAGIGGMTLALDLLERGRIDAVDILIIDAEQPARGRTATTLGPDGQVCDLGAMRFNRRLHPRLGAMLKRFGIATSPVRFTTQYQRGLDVTVLERLARVDLEQYRGRDQGFFRVLCESLDEADARAICDLTGYGALMDERFPLEGGIEILNTRPDSFGDSGGQDGWEAPTHGFAQLSDCVRAELMLAGVAIEGHSRLTAVSRTRGVYELRLASTLDHSERLVDTDKIVLAVPPRMIESLTHPWRGPASWLPNLVDIPCFKLFLTFDEAWWSSGEFDDALLITRNELRKVQFDSRNRTVFLYCDSAASLYWERISRQGPTVLREVACGKLAEATELPVALFESASSMAWKFWPWGVSYFARLPEVDADAAQRLSPDAFASSDAFSPHIGWIEGALVSAEAAIDHLRAS